MTDSVIRSVSRALTGTLSASAAYGRIVPLLTEFGIASPTVGRKALKAALTEVDRFPPPRLAGVGIAQQRMVATNLLRQAAYVVSATQRIAESLSRAAAQNMPDDGALASAVQREDRYFVQHVTADARRIVSATEIDALAGNYGDVLGWYAREDQLTSPECAAADGKNFRASDPPLIGYPGAVHANCRCFPGVPHANAEMLSSAGAEPLAASNDGASFIREFKNVRTPAGAAHYHAPIGTPIVAGEAMPIGWIPEPKWLEGQAKWKAKGEAIWRANEWKSHADLLADRKDAQAKYPIGHSVRVAAERAVRQSRKAGKGAEEAPGIVSSGDPVSDSFKQSIKESDDLLKQTATKNIPQTGTGSVGSKSNFVVRKTDKRISQGQTASNFVDASGAKMSKSAIGDTYEELFKEKGADLLEEKFGGDYRVISHANGASRTTPLDFQLGDRYGGELKTLSKLAKNKKTAIKAEEIERKYKALAEKGLEPLLVAQVVDQQAGTVKVYTFPAFASKKISTMTELGSYKYTPDDFRDALGRAGYGPVTHAMAERLEGGAEYQRLLAERLAAKKAYPIGHPKRLAAEKAVRDARKTLHSGGTPSPPVARAPAVKPEWVPRYAPPAVATPKTTKMLTADISHTYRWSEDPSVNRAFLLQASAAIDRQIAHQETKLSHPIVLDSLPVTVTDKLHTVSETAIGSYWGNSSAGNLRLHPKIFNHVVTTPGQAHIASFWLPGSSPQDVLDRSQALHWWVPTDDKWVLSDNVIAHEIGHGVADSIFDRPDGTGIPNDTQFWSDFAKVTGVAPPSTTTFGEISSWMKANRAKIEKAVSKYGATDPAEMLAELWAEHTLSSNPRPAAKFYGDYVTNLLNAKAGVDARTASERSASLRNLPADVKGFDPGKLSVGDKITFSDPHMSVERTGTNQWEVTILNDNGSFSGAWGRKTPAEVTSLLENQWLRKNGGKT